MSGLSVGVLLTNLWTTAAFHLDSTCRESLDTVASLFMVARLTIVSAAFFVGRNSSCIRAPSIENRFRMLGNHLTDCICLVVI